MISHPLRCIYIHIPKTAGNSVNRVMGIGWENHKDLQRYASEMNPGDFESYFKFAIVRNPWARMLSDYNYQLKKGRPKDSKLFIHTEGGGKRHFGEWVRAALDDPFRYEAQDWGAEVSPGLHRWSPQVDWITVDGRIRVDAIVRMERLPGDFLQVWRALGREPRRLPTRNRRLHWHYSWYYDAPTRDLVGSYYARDIETFGYRFEENPVQLIQNAWSQAMGRLVYG